MENQLNDGHIKFEPYKWVGSKFVNGLTFIQERHYHRLLLEIAIAKFRGNNLIYNEKALCNLLSTDEQTCLLDDLKAIKRGFTIDDKGIMNQARLSKTIKMKKRPESRIVKPMEKDDVEKIIKEKKDAFTETLRPFLSIYDKKMLNEFYAYWTEPSIRNKTVVKWELEVTWDVKRRLNTWYNNSKNKWQKKG